MINIPLDAMPAYMQERVVCSISAALQYDIPVNVLLAVSETENGRSGLRVRNTNGTEDLGPLQFNTAYLRRLSGYGITEADVLAKGCFSYQLAAWRISGHIRRDSGDIWQRAANYHSYTPVHNARYRARLLHYGNLWNQWLAMNYPLTVR